MTKKEVLRNAMLGLAGLAIAGVAAPKEAGAIVEELIIGGSVIAGDATAQPSPEMPDVSACAELSNCEIHSDFIGNETLAGARRLRDNMYKIWCTPQQKTRQWTSRQTIFRSYVTILCADGKESPAQQAPAEKAK